MVGILSVALAHCLGRGDRCSLGHPQKIQGQFTFSFEIFHLIFLELADCKPIDVRILAPARLHLTSEPLDITVFI
jgi:hypothetical protein